MMTRGGRDKNAENLMTSYVNNVICERPLTSEAVKILILILKIISNRIYLIGGKDSGGIVTSGSP